ncbi:MAG: flavodoxin family protein [Defluviitaleaceae bacterium]|nr:flavodoxin family protein [Defluviitaleaceae bacterium]
MKTLIINGSPRRDGDTVSLISEFKKHIDGEVVEISAYYDKIAPCNDCRHCWKHRGCCIIEDDMAKIYADDFDNVVIASPVYISNLTGPVLSLASRFQIYFAARFFLNDPIVRKAKTGVLILAAGGNGGAEPAIDSAKIIFKMMNAQFDDENAIFSLKTDTLPAKDDVNAVKKAKEVAQRINMKGV